MFYRWCEECGNFVRVDEDYPADAGFVCSECRWHRQCCNPSEPWFEHGERTRELQPLNMTWGEAIQVCANMCLSHSVDKEVRNWDDLLVPSPNYGSDYQNPCYEWTRNND